MAEVLDVIANFTYNINDTELQKAATLLTQQVQNVGIYAQRLQNLQNTFDRTSASEIEKRTRIAGLIQKQKAAIDATNASIQKQVSSNKQLQDAIVKEIGLINTLDARLKVLQEDRKKAFDVKDIQNFNRQIAATQKEIAKLSGGGGRFGGLGGSILQGVGIGTGIGLVTQGVSQLAGFIRESSQLAAEVEGVQAAFDRLNQPELLGNLQAATKGTVSDLELMKQAISFNNFGLPLDQLATALEFARRRAKDTGQEVDFLVQSIVTGIGRQSPLILDNLGINAKRVADAFKETGDFAKSAFGIIQEEIQKSGEDLDTFGEKQARVAARVDNLKASFGSLFNSIIAGSLSAGEAFIDNLGSLFLGEDLNEAIARTKKEIEDEDKALAESRLSIFDRYLRDYEQVDEVGKNIIEKNARDSYNELIRQQQLFFNTGQQSLAIALQGQIDQYVDFFSKLRGLGTKQTALSFSTFTQSDLAGLNKNDLSTLREQGVDAMGLLTDPKEIGKLQGRIALIDKALERYSFTVKRVKRDTTDSKVKVRDLIEQTPEQWDAEISKIVDSINKLDEARRQLRGEGDTAIESQSGIQGFREGLISEMGIAPTGEFTTAEILQQQKDAKAKEEQKNKEADDRKQRVKDEIDAYEQVAQAAVQSFNAITNAQLAAKDAQIAIQQERVVQAIELYEKGNTEILEIEKKRLNESIREREAIARRQAIINAALTVSQSILAIATAAGESGAGAVVIVPAVIAAIAAGFGAVTALSSENTPAFKDGVVGFDGEGNETSDSNIVRISKGESVITAAATKKYKDELIAMNNGTFNMIQTPTYTQTSTLNNKIETKNLERKLDKVIEAVEMNKVKVNTILNRAGFAQSVETYIRKENARFKGG